MKLKGTILIVDDSNALLELISEMLKSEGYKAITAQSGSEAISFLESNRPDLILLDRNMPDMDGIEVCKQIKSRKQISKIPIIFLTATKDVSAIVEGFKLGAVDYITKPFQKEELLARANSHINLYRLNQILSKQRSELREREKTLSEFIVEKDKFLSIIGHDLKGPLSNIEQLSILLKSKCGNTSNQKVNEIIDHLISTSRNTNRLLLNLLEWASYQRGKIDYKPVKVDLNDEIKNCFALLTSNAAAKSISLFNEVDCNLLVYVDKNMLNTILRNLVSNAIKFTSRYGIITVSCKTDVNECQVRISDTGIGMAPEVMKKLFSLSKSNTTFGTDGENGTGLGLVLCREFVERNGGKIWAESEVGVGSNFFFTLPLVK